MESFIDREMENPVPEQKQRHRTGDAFGRMLAASILLHIATGLYLMSPGGGAPSAGIPVFDLSTISFPQPPAAMTAPPDQPAEPEPVKTDAPPEPSAREELSQSLDQALKQSETVPEVLQQASLGLGLSRGYFNSLAEGKSLRGDIRVYYFDMLRRLNEVWWAHGVQGMNPGKREALVDLEISREGVLLRRTLVRSTGDRQLDRAILGVVDAASPFPPLPQSYEERTFSAPLRLAVPLNLFSNMD